MGIFSQKQSQASQASSPPSPSSADLPSGLVCSVSESHGPSVRDYNPPLIKTCRQILKPSLPIQQLQIIQQPAYQLSDFPSFGHSPFAITFITAGTLFFIAPNGISAALASIPAFINSWLTPSDVPASRLFLSLLVYQPLTFLLALLAIIRGWRKGSRRIIPLSIWFLRLIIACNFHSITSGQLTLPGRSFHFAHWPHWNSFAMLIFSLEERNEVGGVIFLTAFIWVFAWLDFSGMVWIPLILVNM